MFVPKHFPDWIVPASAYTIAFTARNLSNFDTSIIEGIPQSVYDETGEGRSNNSQITEDCLFLDVTMPKAVFDRAESSEDCEGAPVFVL